jgi:hypothetical protein
LRVCVVTDLGREANFLIITHLICLWDALPE